LSVAQEPGVALMAKPEEYAAIPCSRRSASSRSVHLPDLPHHRRSALLSLSPNQAIGFGPYRIYPGNDWWKATNRCGWDGAPWIFC
jgi:hypothetical protein